MSGNLEYCFVCNNPTDRAGRADDSIYLGSIGPWCVPCYAEVRDAVLCEELENTQAQTATTGIVTLKEEIAHLRDECDKLKIRAKAKITPMPEPRQNFDTIILNHPSKQTSENVGFIHPKSSYSGLGPYGSALHRSKHVSADEALALFRSGGWGADVQAWEYWEHFCIHFGPVALPWWTPANRVFRDNPY